MGYSLAASVAFALTLCFHYHVGNEFIEKVGLPNKNLWANVLFIIVPCFLSLALISHLSASPAVDAIISKSEHCIEVFKNTDVFIIDKK